MFSFWRRRRDTSAMAPAVVPALAETPGTTSTLMVPALTMSGNPTLDQALTAMMDALDDYLPAPSPPLPNPGMSVAGLSERTVGLGSRRGTETRGQFAAVALKGMRLDAQVQYQLWATGPVEAEAAMADLNARLMADREVLWTAGFLRLTLDNALAAEHVPSIGAWRKQADYKVLYEYRYQDSDGAESLIARIPIHSDPEQRNSLQRETTVVTDEMVRWDNEAAPSLVVRGRLSVGGLSMLAYVPSPAPSGAVTLMRTFDGAIGPPAAHPTLAAFLAAVSGDAPSQRHAAVAFVSLDDFITAFNAAGDPVELGDWDLNGVSDSYQARVLDFASPIRLPNVADRLEIAHQGSAFDQVAVVYLRARQG